MSNQLHIPVLLNEAIKYLNPKPGDVFIDGTLGGGGHTMALANKVGKDGMVLSIDLDKNAIKRVESEIKNKTNIKIVHGNFKDLKKIAYDNRLTKVNGIIIDLGLSSNQLADINQGFSFLNNSVRYVCSGR